MVYEARDGIRSTRKNKYNCYTKKGVDIYVFKCFVFFVHSSPEAYFITPLLSSFRMSA